MTKYRFLACASPLGNIKSNERNFRREPCYELTALALALHGYSTMIEFLLDDGAEIECTKIISDQAMDRTL